MASNGPVILYRVPAARFVHFNKRFEARDSHKTADLIARCRFPLPVEVIPMARSHVARELVKLGGDPVYREGVVTDSGNIILDVFNFPIAQPLAMEAKINNITGVVTNGLFALRPADVLLLGTASGVKTLHAE